MNHERNRRQLIEILRHAYSGELAAGLAYRGHWKSLNNQNERAAIQKIEQDEWKHRRRVGEMLADLDAAPRRFREVKMWLIGRTIGLACHLIGRFLPMYFAGRLESGNVIEYEKAASHASELELLEFKVDLLAMSVIEKEHEMFFLSVVASHRLLPLMTSLFKWGTPADSVFDKRGTAYEPID
jgi:demethoxyubiquinone hydroxylase (CLK1/Coq7/Cat5 family)